MLLPYLPLLGIASFVHFTIIFCLMGAFFFFLFNIDPLWILNTLYDWIVFLWNYDQKLQFGNSNFMHWYQNFIEYVSLFWMQTINYNVRIKFVNNINCFVVILVVVANEGNPSLWMFRAVRDLCGKMFGFELV